MDKFRLFIVVPNVIVVIFSSGDRRPYEQLHNAVQNRIVEKKLNEESRLKDYMGISKAARNFSIAVGIKKIQLKSSGDRAMVTKFA